MGNIVFNGSCAFAQLLFSGLLSVWLFYFYDAEICSSTYCAVMKNSSGAVKMEENKNERFIFVFHF